jgi:hypothetical protein
VLEQHSCTLTHDVLIACPAAKKVNPSAAIKEHILTKQKPVSNPVAVNDNNHSIAVAHINASLPIPPIAGTYKHSSRHTLGTHLTHSVLLKHEARLTHMAATCTQCCTHAHAHSHTVTKHKHTTDVQELLACQEAWPLSRKKQRAR